MKTMFKKLSAGIIAIVLASSALAAYPEKQITLLVAMGAGGGADKIARVIADEIHKNTGVPVVVQNVPGAAGIVATAKYKQDNSTDGYTILYVQTGAFLDEPGQQPRSYSNEDFIPISFPAIVPMCIGVNYKTGVKSFDDLVNLAKIAPNNLAYASTGPTDTSVKWATKFEKASGTTLLSVPYKAGTQQIMDLVAGVIPMVISTCAAQAGPMEGKLSRSVAVTSKNRLPSLPDVPTVSELGYKNTETHMWFGVFLNKGTPTDVAVNVSNMFNSAVNSEAVKQTVSKMHGTSKVLSLTGAKTFFDNDIKAQ